MTPIKAAAYIRTKTRTNSSTFTDADIVTFWNKVKDDVCQKALKTDEKIFQVPATLNLVADQREYPLHTNWFNRFERVEAKLDGTNFIKLEEMDKRLFNDPLASETDITNKFANERGKAFFEIARSSIYIYSGSITAVTGGLKIWLSTWPADLANVTTSDDISVDPSTTTHGTPKPLHGVIAEGVVIEYKQGRDKPLPLTDREQNWDDRVDEAIDTLRHANTDREFLADVPYNDGSQY